MLLRNLTLCSIIRLTCLMKICGLVIGYCGVLCGFDWFCSRDRIIQGIDKALIYCYLKVWQVNIKITIADMLRYFQ
jgi:hypothetical protein